MHCLVLTYTVLLFLSDAYTIAGQYHAADSDARARALALAADGRFVFTRPGTKPVSYKGRYTQTENTLALDPEYDEENALFPRMPVDWVIIPWAERTYLVSEGQIVAFCNAVNLGSEPRRRRIGQFLLRQKDWAKPVTGRPQLPAEWNAYLLDQPIGGQLAKIDDKGFGHLSIGGNHGLAAGMILVAYTFDRMRACRLKVLCPCDDSARVEILPIDDPNHPAHKRIDVQIGDAVSTSLKPRTNSVSAAEPDVRFVADNGSSAQDFLNPAPELSAVELSAVDRQRFEFAWTLARPAVRRKLADKLLPVTDLAEANLQPARTTADKTLLLFAAPPRSRGPAIACTFDRITGTIPTIYLTTP